MATLTITESRVLFKQFKITLNDVADLDALLKVDNLIKLVAAEFPSIACKHFLVFACAHVTVNKSFFLLSLLSDARGDDDNSFFDLQVRLKGNCSNCLST